MKLRRRWKVFWNLAALLLVLAVVRRWDPSFDDSALRPPRDAVPEADNAYPVYAAVARDIAQAVPEGVDLTLKALLENPEQGWAFILRVVAPGATHLARLDEIEGRSRCQGPAEGPSGDNVSGDFRDFLQLSRVLTLATADQLHQDNPASAAVQVRRHLRLGWHLRRQPGSEVEAQISIAIGGRALADARRIAADPAAPESVLREMSALLESEGDDRGILRRLAAADYSSFAATLSDWEEKGLVFRTWQGLQGGWNRMIPSEYIRLNAAVEWLTGKAGYLPNRTRRIRFDRNLALTEPREDLPLRDPAWQSLFAGFDTRSEAMHIGSAAAYLRGNFIGEFLATPFAGESWFFDWQRFRTQAALTRVFVALHRHQRRYGHFPGRLEELVPDFLPALLLDPHDGEPMRYESGRGMVYSTWPVDTSANDRSIRSRLALTRPANTEPARDNGSTVLFLLPPADPSPALNKR